MAYFAEIDKNNMVIRVLVIPDEQEHRGEEFLSKDLGLGGAWIETFMDGKEKKNFAGIGYTYDKNRDAFIAPIPNEVDEYYLDEVTCRWKTDKVIEKKK